MPMLISSTTPSPIRAVSSASLRAGANASDWASSTTMAASRSGSQR